MFSQQLTLTIFWHWFFVHTKHCNAAKNIFVFIRVLVVMVTEEGLYVLHIEDCVPQVPQDIEFTLQNS